MTDTQAATLAGAGVLAWLVFSMRGPVGSVSTSEGFDLEPYGGPTSYPEPIKRVARAIARQEGFGVAGSIPQRAHNPGNLKVPGELTLPGTAITAFASDDVGWSALYRQLYLILTGRSSFYTLDMTIAEMARRWTATETGAWASNVSTFLGVTPAAPLWSVLA